VHLPWRSLAPSASRSVAEIDCSKGPRVLLKGKSAKALGQSEPPRRAGRGLAVGAGGWCRRFRSPGLTTPPKSGIDWRLPPKMITNDVGPCPSVGPSQVPAPPVKGFFLRTPATGRLGRQGKDGMSSVPGLPITPRRGVDPTQCLNTMEAGRGWRPAADPSQVPAIGL
jgi:hypothetical protein